MVIEVFKAGTWTDSSGNTRTWTEQDIDKIIEKYNSQRDHEAPVVIGHPKDNAPAYGWVERLEKRGQSIWAKIKPTVQDFVDWVRQGLYKKVSISLYPDLLLRHIGFLGAMPPAVKGLQVPQFSDAEYSEYTMDFRKWTQEERDKLAKGEIKGEFAGPDQSFPIAGPEDVGDAWKLSGHAENPDQIRLNIIRIAKKYGWVSALPKSARQWAKEHNIDLMEVQMEEKLKELEKELKEKEKALAEFAERDKAKEEEIAKLREEIARVEKEKRQTEFNSFCEDLIKEGKLTPAMKPAVIDFLEILHGFEEYEFSEGEGKVKAKPGERFKTFLKGLPKVIEYGEKATKDKVGQTKTVDFEADGKVDEERMELHKKALQHMEKNQGISYIDALKKVIKEA
jgi:hypothetical protein